jgi:hypothetical protein
MTGTPRIREGEILGDKYLSPAGLAMIRSRRFALFALMSLLLIAPAAFAWGPLGHSVVADLAWRQLTPAARAAVNKLLVGSQWKSLASLASWPDEIRNERKYQSLWKRTRHLHYINFDSRDCDYKPRLQCKDGSCVVAAIEHYEKVLADPSQAKVKRRRALIFVVHLIGDVHQPLHAGYRRDAGGNRYQVQFEGKGSNLHRVWDSGMLRTRHMSSRQYADFLAAQGPVELPATKPGVPPPVQWAERSCRITRKIYPHGHKIGPAYVHKWLPVADRQLRIAGARLANVLNRILD